jgi:hypothetical protein
MVTIQDTCINSKSSNPFVDDGFVWCRLEEGYIDCTFDGRWNECPHYKPVRQAMRELVLHSHVRRTKVDQFGQLSEMSNDTLEDKVRQKQKTQ